MYSQVRLLSSNFLITKTGKENIENREVRASLLGSYVVYASPNSHSKR